MTEAQTATSETKEIVVGKENKEIVVEKENKEIVVEETKEIVVEKDVECDAPGDKRKRLAKPVAFNVFDATINVLVSTEGTLSTFQQSGLGSLLAGVRANTGIKQGRYYYEAKVVDVVPNQGRHEIRVGFSTSTADYLGGSNSFLFDLLGGSVHIGETSRSHGKRARTPDVVGVLLNRDEKSEQKNTISLFINGERATDPQKLPEGCGALYPHVVFKGCYVAVNFNTIIAPLPFTVRMIGDASLNDVEATTVVASTTQEVFFPIGFSTDDYIEELSKSNPDFVVLSTKSMRSWVTRSGQKTVACCEDGGKHIGGLLRNRKFIVAMSDTLVASERKGLCARFAGYKKIAKVYMGEPKHYTSGYSAVTLPIEEEGFDVVEYVTPKEEAEKKLDEWKVDCKLRSRIDDLKVGTFFKEKIDEFKKLAEEKKQNEEEYPLLSDEDYMLVLLRAEIHYLLHAFVEDAGENRPGFAALHLCHYYKLYTQKTLSFSTFGLGKVEDLIDLIPELLLINEKTLLTAKMEKDIAQETFFDQTESARLSRQDRLDAGDENAALKFTAKSARGKGKGGERTLRVIPMKRPISQTWEQSETVRR